MQDEPFRDVFQHRADDASIRRFIVNLIDQLINRTGVDTDFPRMTDTKGTTSAHCYERIKSEFDRRSYCRGSHLFNLRTSGHDFSKELPWKWTEKTGNHIGCPYWSQGAREVFYRELANTYGTSTVTLSRARQFAETLRKGKYGQNALNHEHVFPIRQISRILREHAEYPQYTGDQLRIERFLQRLVIGCIVLKSEHRQVNNRWGNEENPWLRYKGSVIKLVANSEWTAPHRKLIEEAGLL